MKVKTKIRICRTVGFLLFLMMLGIVRGMDMGIMPVVKGAILSISCELVGAFLLYKAGVVHVR